MDNEKVFAMSIGKAYPLLIAKVERKGRSKEELDEVTRWLTGYSQSQLSHQLSLGVSYRQFFDEAPCMNPNAELIKGSICGIKLDAIEDPLMLNIRRLDKLADELAKGKSMDKILRKP